MTSSFITIGALTIIEASAPSPLQGRRRCVAPRLRSDVADLGVCPSAVTRLSLKQRSLTTRPPSAGGRTCPCGDVGFHRHRPPNPRDRPEWFGTRMETEDGSVTAEEWPKQ